MGKNFFGKHFQNTSEFSVNKIDTNDEEKQVVPISPLDIHDNYVENYQYFEKWICPHCRYRFDKPLLKKRQCPHCHKVMVVRTHFNTKKKMLIKEEDLKSFEELQLRYYEDYHDSKWLEDIFKYYETSFEGEKKKSGSPFINDVAWAMLNRHSGQLATKMQWGMYRNTRAHMARLLLMERKLKPSLSFYLEVCYYDIIDTGNINNNTLRPVQPKRFGFLAPGIVVQIKKIANELELELIDLKKMFIEHNQIVQQDNVLIPLSAVEAWSFLEKELA